MSITPLRFKILISIFVFIVGFGLITRNDSYVFAQVQDGTGGTTIAHIGGYTIHTFTGNGTFNPGPAITSVEYLVVAGGGGGGNSGCGGGTPGGGGGGGVVYNPSFSVVANTDYPVVVGAPGPSGGAGTGGSANNGGNSIFNSTIIAYGGGGGGCDVNSPNHNGGVGSSGGGGASGWCGSGGATNGAGQGYAGTNSVCSSAGGGGGGAGGAAGAASTGVGGGGGAGVNNSISGSSLCYGEGGGGLAAASGVPGCGRAWNTPPAASRGGGGENGAGASGTVIIRYLTITYTYSQSTYYTYSQATYFAPTVTTTVASSITSSGATLNGSANPGGAATTGWFRYRAVNPGSCNDSFGTRLPSSGGISLGSGNSDVSYSNATGAVLSPQTHYYCAIASNSVAISFGSIKSFTVMADACTINAGQSIKINWSSRYSRDCSVYEDLNSNGVYNAGTDTLIWSGTSNNAINGSSNGPLFSSKTYKIDCTGLGSTLTKTSGTNVWDSGASSIQSVASGDVYTEFSTNENNTYKMGGLNNGDANQSYTDIDYAIYPAADTLVYIFENGTYIGNFSTYVAGDIFRVAVESGVVKYYKNGLLLYTSGVAPTYPLRFDSSLYSPNATITDVSLTGSPARGVDFQSIVGVSANSGVGATTNSADTLLVTVIAPPPPTISSTTVTVNNSNYCGSGIHATVSATVTSSDASDLTAYEMQIDDDSDPLLGNPEWESGTIVGSFPSGSTISRIVQNCNPAPANPDATPQIACQMNWNTVYRAWVRARDQSNQWSSWVLMSTYCNGASCGAATSWITPIHAFPDVDPPSGTGGCSPPGFDFSWTPCSPSVGSPVQFTDRTNFAAGSIVGSREWVWAFTGGSPLSSTIQNPLPVTYSAVGSYSVIESVRDDAMPAGVYCTVTKNVSLQTALPRWREVAPR